MKTLILDDDFAGRLVLQRMVHEYGEVKVAASGTEALKMFVTAHDEGDPFEVIFLDLMLPQMSGQTVLREIRSFEQQKGIAKNRAARILMTTALNDRESVLQAIKYGCDAYLVKPLQPDQVMDYLRKFGKIA
jgi:two-component system, chemotaxis family, chemotaxis protein CheY